MKNLWWLVLTLGLVFYPKGVLALTPPITCGWCGTSCGEMKPNMACIALAPPEGQECVYQNNSCVVVPKETSKYVGEGEACGGGIRGLTCAEGLVCKYEDSGKLPPMTGKTGICVKELFKPTCIPRPACLDGIKDPETGRIMYCDMPEGAVFCPTEVGGDANSDGKVDLIDFSIWKKEYLNGSNDKVADFNKDSKVNLVDFSIWKASYLINKNNEKSL